MLSAWLEVSQKGSSVGDTLACVLLLEAPRWLGRAKHRRGGEFRCPAAQLGLSGEAGDGEGP